MRVEAEYSCVMENVTPEVELRSQTVTFQYEKQSSGLYKAIAFLSPATGAWVPVGIEMPLLTFNEMIDLGCESVTYSDPGHVDTMMRNPHRVGKKRRQLEFGTAWVKDGREKI